ncbi:putative S-layer domain-containing protein [Helianthus anomalus]
MCSSSSTPTFFPLHTPRTNRHFLKHPYPYPFPPLTHDLNINLRPTNPRTRKIISLSSSVAQHNLKLSWAPSDKQDVEDYNGWAIVEESVGSRKQSRGLPTFVLVGIGTSVAALLAVFAHFGLSRKGFVLRFSSPFHVSVDKKSLGSEDGSKVDEGLNEPLVENVDEEVDAIAKEVNGHGKWEEGKPGRVVVPVFVDATQQEALSWLKNLKIIEDEVKADELCTRREYARWLVVVNSRLERNPRHRILPSVALAGSTVNAFNDISAEDPDFEYIQALAEAGVVLSKLSGENLTSDLDSIKSSGGVNFFPERLISREDLIGWRAKLEYQVMPGLNEEILRNKIGFLDARELKSDVLAVLFRDTLTNEKSIMRKVFGQIKRFQPAKPCTKAQAAVALTSGRITNSVRHEFAKREAENTSRKIAMKEIKSTILERGEIQRFWEKKIADERRRYLEVESAYLEALNDLENEKNNQDNVASNYLKEVAALECQKQLLCSLKEEVDEMNERIGAERAGYVDEERKVRSTVRELEVKYEKILDSKSILEAELEALRILRSWIEDEAKKGQAQTKVLEEVGRRWKWGSSSS